jgi:hypothetical protein
VEKEYMLEKLERYLVETFKRQKKRVEAANPLQRFNF